MYSSTSIAFRFALLLLSLLLISSAYGRTASTTSKRSIDQFYSYVTVPSKSVSGQVVQMFSSRTLGQNMNDEYVVERRAVKTLLSSFPDSIPLISPLITRDIPSTFVHEHYLLNDERVVLNRMISFDSDIQNEFPRSIYFKDLTNSTIDGRIVTHNNNKNEWKQNLQEIDIREYTKSYGSSLQHLKRRVTESVSLQTEFSAVITNTSVTRMYQWYSTDSQDDNLLIVDTISNLLELQVTRSYCSDQKLRVTEKWLEYYYHVDSEIPLLIETHYPNGLKSIQQETRDTSCVVPSKKRSLAPHSSAPSFAVLSTLLLGCLLSVIAMLITI